MAFDPKFQAFIERFAVTGLSAVGIAATAAVLMLLAAEFGFSLGIQVGLALTYGLATIAWPYSKYFYTEPVSSLFITLAVLFAVRAARSTSFRTWVFTGAWIVLATATRPDNGVLLPVVALWAVFRQSQVPLLVRLRAWLGLATGFVPVLLLVGWYNYVRFGNPLDTGNGFTLPGVLARTFIRNPLPGLYGLTVSPGKGLLLYSPVLILALEGVRGLWRRRPRETALLGATVAAVILLHAPLTFWAGDTAWGPRYTVSETALMLLPLGIVFERARDRRWLRAVCGLALSISVLVQMVGVAVNYNTYMLVTNGASSGPVAERRWYVPSASPLVIDAQYLVQRVNQNLGNLAEGQFDFHGGIYAPEQDDAPLPRWTNGDGLIDFRVTGRETVQVAMRLQRQDITYPPSQLSGIIFAYDGQLIAPGATSQASNDAMDVILNLSAMPGTTHRLAIISPSKILAGQDRRMLGTRIDNITIRQGTQELAFVELPNIPQLFVTAKQPWSRAAFGWFYHPRFRHLFDTWWWYFWQSGLPRWTALGGLIPLSGAMLCGWGLARAFASEGWSGAARPSGKGPQV